MLVPELTVAVCMLQCLPDKNLPSLHDQRHQQLVLRPESSVKHWVVRACATVSLLRNAICIGTYQMLLNTLLGLSWGGT